MSVERMSRSRKNLVMLMLSGILITHGLRFKAVEFELSITPNCTIDESELRASIVSTEAMMSLSVCTRSSSHEIVR